MANPRRTTPAHAEDTVRSVRWLGNFLGNNCRRLPPSRAVPTRRRVENPHLKPYVAVPTDFGEHVSRAAVRFDLESHKRSGWWLASSGDGTIRAVLGAVGIAENRLLCAFVICVDTLK
jgi:hypothetical protein